MADGPSKLAPREIEAGADAAGKLCSICQTGILAGERIVACPYCALPFHSECWTENQGCSAYGCEGAPPTIKPKVDTAPLSNAWGSDKPCPNCGETIKAQALKCRFCGASFGTRDVISEKDFAGREYDGKEYAAVRNKVIGLFILSAAACLSPIGLVLVVMLIKRKELMGIDYNRLPAALRAVLYSSLAISSLLLLVMIGFLIFD